MAEQLEHQCEPGQCRGDAPEMYLRSIAISLKRIADALDEPNEYGEGPAAAIGAGIARALNR